MKGSVIQTLPVNHVLTSGDELSVFSGVSTPVTGLSVSGMARFSGEEGLVRIILEDKNHQEYLVYEMYPMLSGSDEVSFKKISEETCLLENISPLKLRVELQDATLDMESIDISFDRPRGADVAAMRKEIHLAQNGVKIARLNRNLREKGKLWVAGHTSVSELSFAERKKLYGQSKFPEGMEFYTGGILQTGPLLKAASASPMVSYWDWRNRHGKFWISPVKNQGGCGSCWAFAATGATEAQVNLFFNQLLNLNLSEQDVLSCSGAGTCNGGFPGSALNYIAGTGIVDEAAFPYTATDQLCSNKSASPAQLIKIAGKVDFPSANWPMEEDALKKMIIKYGPLSGGIYDWSHAIVLVGWQVVKEGDRFYTRDLNKSIYWITVPAGSPLIGTTVWIFKNSWGAGWGDAGYVYIQTSMSNVGWTHALLNPVQSIKQSYNVVCADNDGDGYFWWGLGPKPASCTGPDTPDGNDSDPTLGPLDQYGHCIMLGNPPVANFTADKVVVDAGGTVRFTDLSQNAPATWVWTFEGGTPSSSSSQNPTVVYNSAGTFDVTLLVSNADGTSSKTITDFITVNAFVPSYCSSYGNSTREWISQVTVNGITNNSGTSGTIGYSDYTSAGPAFQVNPGETSSITLKPAYSSKTSNAEYFSVWIDLNNDKDFSDTGELVATATKIKSAITRSFVIPSGTAPCITRMRVSMKRNALSSPCEVISSGEVEDYKVTIGAPGTKSAVLSSNGRDFIKIYPNPAHSSLMLELSELYPGDHFVLCSVQGVLIRKAPLEKNVTVLDIADLSPGVYLMEIRNGRNRVIEKIIRN